LSLPTSPLHFIGNYALLPYLTAVDSGHFYTSNLDPCPYNVSQQSLYCFKKLFQLQRQPITLQINFLSLRNEDSRLLSKPPSTMFPITNHSPTLISSSYFSVVSAATSSKYQSMCRYYCASTFASSIRSCRQHYWHNI